MLIEVLRDKALLLAAVNAEEAQKTAKAYIDMQLPTDQLELRIQEIQREALAASLDKIQPIPFSEIKFG